MKTTFLMVFLALVPLVKAGAVSVVATTGMVTDLVRGVGGDRVEVHQLMGAGVDPHVYKPTAGDASKLAKADAVFYNGLHLEARMGELFERLEKRDGKVFAVSDSIPRERLIPAKGAKDLFDPHVWFDAALWAGAVPAVVEGLSAADPSGRADYEKNGEALRAKLLALDAWCRSRAGEIPREKRILVTSHDAFGYFGRAYGFEVVGLQGMSTVTEASLADISALADFLREKKTKAVFVETSVNPEAMKRVAENAGVAIGGNLFSDALGEPGEMLGGYDTGTYDGMMRHNMATIVEALR